VPAPVSAEVLRAATIGGSVVKYDNSDGGSGALTETAKSFRGFARSQGRHADSGFAVSRELGVNSPFLSSNACAMAGDLLLKNAVDATVVAFRRKSDSVLGRRVSRTASY
jgi:hypothetical protein